MSGRQTTALALAFFVTQLLIVLASADRIGEPDLAEVGVMALGDAWASGEPATLEQVVRAARAGPNAPHGGHLPVALLYAALACVFGAGSYLALKLVAVGFATVGFAAWTAVAGRIGGAGAAWAAAALLWACPPSALSGRLIAWGSHPESAALLGVAAWATLRFGGTLGGAAVVGAALGAAVGVGRLTVAAVAVLGVGWALDQRGGREGRGPWVSVAVAGAVAAGLVLASMGLSGAWQASVTETPGSTPAGLIAAGGTDLVAALGSLLPLRVVPDHLPGPSRLFDACLAGLAVGSMAVALPGAPRGRRTAVLAGAAAAHLLLVATLSPQRPAVPARYLLPLWPLIAVAVAVGAARWFPAGGARRVAAVVAVVAWCVPGAVVQVDLFEPSRIPAFFDYHPRTYATRDIGKVTYATAPGVDDFLLRRPNDVDAFRLVAGSGAGQDLLMRPAPHPVAPRDLAARIARRDDVGPARIRKLEAVGWGLAVFAADRPGTRRSSLTALGAADRVHVGRGIGMGLRAQGLDLDLWGEDPDADAVRAGARALEAEAAAGATPPLPRRPRLSSDRWRRRSSGSRRRRTRAPPGGGRAAPGSCDRRRRATWCRPGPSGRGPRAPGRPPPTR